MKTISTGLATLFTNNNTYNMADLYTFTLTNGTVLKLTNYDTDLIYGVNTWLSTAPIFERTSVRTVIGLEVGTLNIKISPEDTDLIGTKTWLQAVYSGVLDGALVSLDRAFWATGSAVAGTVNVFTGYVAQLSLDRVSIEMVVNSPMDALNIQMPRNLYQAGCQHALYDSGCTVAKATFTKSGSIIGSTSLTNLTATITGAATGTLSLGTMTFSTGTLAGTKRTIKSWDGSNLILLNPLPSAPTGGDTFIATYGCDKQTTTCSGTFSNLANFKGYPYVPVPETAV
jgi:uncharacterized phage protein (TIGR02218 family)